MCRMVIDTEGSNDSNETRLSQPRLRDVLDRLENLDVGTTATDIAIEVAPNEFSGGLGMRLQERFAG